MDAATVERNIADCETKIDSLDARISKAEDTGENVKDLKAQLKGYTEARAKLKALGLADVVDLDED